MRPDAARCVDISTRAALQQMIIGGYPVVMLGLIAIVMVQWQKRTRAVEKPKPTPVSAFGRPMQEGPG